MRLESRLAANNASLFLREFTYSASRFRSNSGGELELCDGAIWIDDLLLLFQLKERNDEHASTDENIEAKWFDKKVSKLGVDQLVDTINYLENERTLPLANLRGQTIDLTAARPMHLFKLVLYASSQSLPISRLFRKGRQSSRIGFVHFMQIDDYINVCRVLHTPYEISEYLDFREATAIRFVQAHEVSEKAMLGKYLSDSDPKTLSADDERHVDNLIDDRHEFNVDGLLKNYLDRIAWGNESLETQYHAILVELAKLRRNTLKIFRDRLLWAMKTCREDMLSLPSRFFDTKTACGFIFIPVTEPHREDWRKLIEYYTLMCKYDFRASKCIGVSVAPDIESTEHHLVNWLFVSGDWEADAEFEMHLSTHDVFRKTQLKSVGRYNFKER